MIFTSYHPVYTLADARTPADLAGYHRFHIGKTVEFSVLWYLYTRAHLGPDEHIIILDQGGPHSIDTLLRHIPEPYSIGVANEAERFDVTAPGPRLHVRSFPTAVGIREGVKRLYHYIYKIAYKNDLDILFIENDCLVSRDWLGECRRGGVDFATNTIALQNHRACDTYINYISAARLHDMDALMPLDQWLDWVKATYGAYDHPNDWDALYDVSSTILNERGAYLRFCYGNVLTFNNQGIMHSVANGDADRVAFLKANPLDHPYYTAFLAQVEPLLSCPSS